MRARAALLIVVFAALEARADEARAERLLFVGDVLLSRQVADEIRERGTDPWRHLRGLFAAADWVGGNLEGAVGEPGECNPRLVAAGTCFAVPAALLARVREAGFAALALDNNHRADLRAVGRARTRAAVADSGLLPLTFERSPEFVRVGSLDVAVIALDRVADVEGAIDALPSVELARKLRLARALAQLTLVSVHWGRELVDTPDASQRAAATWLVEHGADVVLGHHPHVVQPSECVSGRPVYFSLGNHLFDQKYPETRRGRIADCSLDGAELRCGALATEAAPRSTTPSLVGVEEDVRAALASCPVPLRERLTVDGHAIRALPTPVRSERLEVALAGGPAGAVPTRAPTSGARGGRRSWRHRPFRCRTKGTRSSCSPWRRTPRHSTGESRRAPTFTRSRPAGSPPNGVAAGSRGP
ncbi:MAG: CapA family protein [bacterium]